MTEDERRIAEIEGRVRLTQRAGDEYLKITRKDFDTLINSRLAWKFTAKCFSVTNKQKTETIHKLNIRIGDLK